MASIISAGEIYYVIEECMLREWPGIDDNEMRYLMIGEEVEYLGTESGEYEEYMMDMGYMIRTSFKKVKTDNGELGWIAAAFLIEKKSMTHLSTDMKNRTINKIINIIGHINTGSFASMDVSELKAYLESIVDNMYEFTGPEESLTIAGSGFTAEYCIAAAQIDIFYNPDAEPALEYEEYPEEYYEAEDAGNNAPDMPVFVYMWVTVPIELKDEIVNRLIELYGKSEDMNHLQWSSHGISTYITSGEDEASIENFFIIGCGLEGL
jgi:hypothetical protein